MGKKVPIITSFIQAVFERHSPFLSLDHTLEGRIADSLVQLCRRNPTVGKQAIAELLDRVADLHRKNEELERITVTDPLTGAYNRLYFEKAIKEMKSGSHPEKRNPTGQHYLMMIDLDKFKEINDTYGHDAGDAVLRHVVDSLTDMTRETDAVCRIGGDEFVVILRDANLKGAKQKIIEITDALESLPFVWKGKEIKIGASVGYAEIDPANFKTDVLRQIDLDMYAAKKLKGGGRSREHAPQGNSELNHS